MAVSHWASNSQALSPASVTLFPLLLILATFPAAWLMAHVNLALGGSWAALGSALLSSPVKVFQDGFLAHVGGDDLARAGKVIGAFCLWQLITMRLVPGKIVKGNVTAGGAVPEYIGNGLQCFFLTIAAFIFFSADAGIGARLPADAHYDLRIFYDIYPTFICIMPVAALVFCAFLWIKGNVAPSGPDHGSSGNGIVDFFWGMELYPRVLGWDVKMFTNCRFGMMLWAVLPISFAAAAEAHGVLTDAFKANLVLQLIYVAKFFWWEMGYMKTIDIQHDRAGYYICWGCLSWITSLYVSHSYYIATTVVNAAKAAAAAAAAGGASAVDTAALKASLEPFSPAVTALIVVVGFLCIFINYDADRQREHFRLQDGKCNILGRPAEYIEAFYETEVTTKDPVGGKPVVATETRRSLLLASGWWGISRHFHYVPEILAAFCWSIPGGLTHFMPFSYVVFLIILLVHRAHRDELRMHDKYGNYYKEYAARVPYMIIPYIY